MPPRRLVAVPPHRPATSSLAALLINGGEPFLDPDAALPLARPLPLLATTAAATCAHHCPRVRPTRRCSPTPARACSRRSPPPLSAPVTARSCLGRALASPVHSTPAPRWLRHARPWPHPSPLPPAPPRSPTPLCVRARPRHGHGLAPVVCACACTATLVAGWATTHVACPSTGKNKRN